MRKTTIPALAAVVCAALVLGACQDTSFYSVLGNKVQVQKLAISPGSTTVSSNGTIQFSASGGVPPYTFSILSGVGTIDPSTGLYTAPATPGTTYIEVTDKQGSTATATVTNVDYSVTAVNDTSSSHLAGAAASGSFTVQNIGTANGTQTVSWTAYVSASNTLGGGATTFAQGTTSALNAGASATVTFTGAWPSTPGTYYLIVTVFAADGLVASNNTLPSSVITVTAANVDYAVSSVSITSASTLPGGAVSGSFTLTNNGPNSGTQYVNWQAYASTTTTVTGSSVLITSRSTPPLGNGASTTINYSGVWPLTYGNYFVVIQVSVPVDVDTNSANNVAASPVTAVGFFNALSSETANNLLATAPNLGVTFQPGMSISISGSLATSDTTDYLGFNTGTASKLTFNMTWGTTGSTQTVTMYVYSPSPAPLGTALAGLSTTFNTYLIMAWNVDAANTVRYISPQLSGTTSAGTYTLIITAN